MRTTGRLKVQARIIERAAGDPLMVSEAYYKRAVLNFQNHAWLDGLIDLHLAEEHLIGRYAPRHKPIDRPSCFRPNGCLPKTK